MNIYSIYKITNTKNNKVYIGFTKNFERRVVEHTRNSKKLNSHLYYAIKKHGIEVFTFEIVYQSLDFEHSKNIMETYFINLYDSYYSGYNMTLGGDGTFGRKWTDEQKQLASIRNKGHKSENKGKTYIEIYGEEKAKEKIEKNKNTWTKKRLLNPKQKIPKLSRLGLTYKEIFGEERAKEISDKKRIKMLGENNPRYGKPGSFTGRKHSDETIAKIKGKTFEERFGEQKAAIIKEQLSKANTGENNPMYGKVGGMNGKKHSDEARAKMSMAQKNKNKPTYLQDLKTCPHCQKTSTLGNATRWHFDNCKFKPN